MTPPDRLNYPEPISSGCFPLPEATAGGVVIGDHLEGRSNKGAGEISPVSLAPVLLMIVALFPLVLFDLARSSVTHRTTVCLCLKSIASESFE